MKLKNLSIGRQLFFGFAAVIVAILLLSAIAYKQGRTLHEQTKTLYNHPLVVRRAIADVEIGITKMRLATRDLMLASNKDQQEGAILDVIKAEQAVELSFKKVFSNYLGNSSDVDNAYTAYKTWNAARQKNLQYASQGRLEDVKKSISENGEVGLLRNEMLSKIQMISDFSKVKATDLYSSSQHIASNLLLELLLSCLLILIFTIFVGLYFARQIRVPLTELHRIVLAYRAGNLDVRSNNDSGNEIGTLAKAFNDLLDNVKVQNTVATKLTRISDAMLVEDNSHTFFRTLLPVLAAETNSQIAAIYLLNDTKSEFYLYESVGLSTQSEKLRFSANHFDGEFGAVLASHKIHFVRSIPKQTIFTFNTVSGSMIPREIVTLPILKGNVVVAVLSVASLRNYDTQMVDLFYKIFDVLSARINGILSYRAIRKAATQLREQNIELEQQRNELNQQSLELVQQNGELEIQKNQLKEASRLKTTFLSNMSHELRTPLNSVIALSGVLNRRLKQVIPEDEYSYIGVIERNGRHLLALINDILDISRIESGREEVEINEFDMSVTTADVIEMIQPQANEHNIQLIHHNPKSTVILQSDSKKVRHIIQNLIANAVKFTEKGSVEVNISKVENQVLVCVKDSGIGISQEQLLHIFDEFRQADSSTSRRFGGTGLGLSIARKYARLLHGDITVVSEPNSGSEFTLVLPEKMGEQMDIQELDPTFDVKPVSYYSTDVLNNRNENEHGVQKNILLVEDSEPAVIQIKDMLESNNYTVHAARSGAEALQFLSEYKPDAMILDLMMPVMDGFELLEKIRNFEKTKEVPVLILTAKHITKEDIQFLKNNNVHQLIQKGDVQRDALLNAVYSMVAKSPRTDAMHGVSINAHQTNAMHGVSTNSKPLVLIVEDNIDNMTTVKAVIGDKFRTIEAVNGIEAVQMANQYVPDFILMDIALPELDGIQAFKQIHTNPHLTHIPVIALTASAMLLERETILAYGFDAYIPKPIDEKQFFEIVNTVLYGK